MRVCPETTHLRVWRAEAGQCGLKGKAAEKERGRCEVMQGGRTPGAQHGEKEAPRGHSRQGDNGRSQLQSELHVSEVFSSEWAFGRAQNPHSH